MKGTPTGFWAKLRRNEHDEIVAWHSLLGHSADVAAMTEALLLRTILGERMAKLASVDSLSDVQIQRFCVLAAIHDAGKANNGFQGQAFGRPGRGHVMPMIEVIEAPDEHKRRILLALKLQEVVGWFESEGDLIDYLLATWAHHGKPVLPQYQFDKRLWIANRLDPVTALEELADHAREWFPTAFGDGPRLPTSNPSMQHVFNGILTLADWMGSDERFFDYHESNTDPIERARESASRAVESLHLDTKNGRGSLGVEPVGFDLLSEFDPFEMQRVCMELPIPPDGGLCILEAETGSGKTEAALGRFLRLYQAGAVEGMYFAVPTRSAATQLHDRIRRSIARTFPDPTVRPPVVLAVPGYIRVDDDEGTPLPRFEVLWPDNRNEELRLRGWAAETPKRFLASPIAVGTIDQVLLSSLAVKHAHMRAACLLRHLLVVDEVHASDEYMTSVLEVVLRHHLESGGHALLMSATLGSAARLRLTGCRNPGVPVVEESIAAATSRPYPMLSHTGSGQSKPSLLGVQGSGPEKGVMVTARPIAADPDAIAAIAVSRSREGGRVLLIRNVVADCIATQRAVEKLAPQVEGILFGVNGIPAPHHSRFAPSDRGLLDEAIEKRFGKNSHGPCLAVSTQTVEQSLDIDADYLITDLCPIDVLLQRIGRLHRHVRDRAEPFKHASCLVLVPENRDLSSSLDGDGKPARGKHGLGTVYADLRVLEATWRLLETKSVFKIPSDNRSLVEGATHPDVLRGIVAELGPSWQVHEGYLIARNAVESQSADLVAIDRRKPFSAPELFPSEPQKITTRLGVDNYRVRLPEPIVGPFGKTVQEVTVPDWQLGMVSDMEDDLATNVDATDGGFQFSFAGRRFEYDRFGLRLIHRT